MWEQAWCGLFRGRSSRRYIQPLVQVKIRREIWGKVISEFRKTIKSLVFGGENSWTKNLCYYISFSNKWNLDVNLDVVLIWIIATWESWNSQSSLPQKGGLDWGIIFLQMSGPLRMAQEYAKMYNLGQLLARAPSNANKTVWSLAYCAELCVQSFIRMFQFTDKNQHFSSELYHVWLCYFCS